MKRLTWILLALLLIIPCGLSSQQADQTTAKPAILKDLILQGNITESVRIAEQEPDAVAKVLEAILEEVDLQITDRKIAEAGSALASVKRFVDAYAPEGNKGMPMDEIRGRILRVEGIQLSDQKQYEEAEAKLKQALELSVRARDQRLEAGIHNNLGFSIQFQKDRIQEAADQYDTARSMAEEQKDPLRAGSYNFNLGLTLLQLGQNEPALHAFQRAEEQNHSASKTIREAQAILYQGVALGRIKQMSKDPIPYFARASKMFEQLGDDRNAGASLWMLAQQTAFTGDMPEAARVTERAVPFFVKVEDKRMLITCYEFLAGVYSHGTSADDKEKAEKYKKLAEETRKQIEK